MAQRIAFVLGFLLAFAVACTSTPPNGTCSSDSECTAGRCLNSTCFPKRCGGTACGVGQVCANESCVDELCVDKTCEAGAVCVRGSCLPTACTTKVCGASQVCENEICVDLACVGVVCPLGSSCAAGVCSAVSCGGLTCQSTEVCDEGHCVDPSCQGVRCDAGSACASGSCHSTSCGGQVCDGGVCRDGSCVEPACATVSCDGGTTCRSGTCVEDACLPVACDAGAFCTAGQCVSVCTVSCAAPCPTCTNGRGCGGNLECDSRFCSSGVCTACTGGPANNCPNGGVCSNGICRSGLEGPCTTTLDCNPTGLTCDLGTCRNGLNASCATDAQCISSLRCENLVCQRPRCMLQNIESQVVPGLVVPWSAQAIGLSQVGELLVSQGQWDNNYANSNVRRFRVAPGVVMEQDPQAPTPLLALPENEGLPLGHSDTLGTAAVRTWPNTDKHFWWIPAGGAFDGRLAVDIFFTGFDADVTANLQNGGFAKCGDSFFFWTSLNPTGKVMLRYTTPQPLGSGSTVQTLISHTVRRDNWPFTAIFDINCTANAVYVLGTDGTGVKLQQLDYNLAAVGAAVSMPGSVLNSAAHDWALATVSDAVHFGVSRTGIVNQVVDGGVKTLSNLGTINVEHLNMSTPDVVVLYDNDVSTVRRYKRVMMNGSVPPLDLDCQWQ